MNVPHRAYQQQSTPNWTRIDMLLALLDGTIERLQSGLAALHHGETAGARAQLGRAHVMALELAAGINLAVEDPASVNLLRLYEFVAHSTSHSDPIGIETSINVLKTVRDGFRSIRQEAIELERSGKLPPPDQPMLVETTA
jgi:flagellin-specific chaperone FliS